MNWCRGSTMTSGNQGTANEKPYPSVGEQHGRSVDSVNAKYFKFHIVTFIIFTKLESSTSHGRACLTHNIYTRSDSNLMPSKRFRTLFPKLPVGALHVTRKIQSY